MAIKRFVTEMGMGVDVHGSDYTKAAKRAVTDMISTEFEFLQGTR